MSTRIHAALGLALLGAHVALAPVLLSHCERPRLRVAVTAPVAAARLSVTGSIPDALVDRVRVTVDGLPRAAVDPAEAGLRHVRWTARYRGDVTRSAGFTQLVGPRQDASAPPCSMRVVIGQSFLDRIEPLVAERVHAEFEGFEKFPLGGFERVGAVALRWEQLDGPRPPSARGPYLHVRVRLRFDRGAVPVTLALFPRVREGHLTIDAVIDAELDWDNRIFQTVSDVLGGDDHARATARQELDAELRQILAPPPELPLPDGEALRFDYCPGVPLRAVPGRHLAVPLTPVVPEGELGPLRLGPPELPTSPPTDAPFAIDMNVDLLNAALWSLWHSGFLDRRLAELGLEERFNDDPLVRELLSVRADDLHLALPPTLVPSGAPGPNFRLAAELALTLRDHPRHTPARLFGRVDLAIAGHGPDLGVDVRLGLLRLTCHSGPRVITACYDDLVEQVRTRAGDLHQPLTRAFVETFDELVVDRAITTEGALGHFVVDRAEVTAPAGMVRVTLRGDVVAD